VSAAKKRSGFEDFCNTGENFPKEKVEIQNTKRKLQSMKNGDTIATVIAFFLVLPWLARLIASAKAIWRALTAGQNKKRNQAV
jgi:hypothetical protein